MELLVLSSKNYEEPSKNHGDCFIINNDIAIIVYDCGSEEHAKRIIEYVEKTGINDIIVILSHNDSDHFDGIPILIESGKVRAIYTDLLLKYVDELLERIDDKRKTRESIKKQILEMYSNIAKLKGENLQESEVYTQISKGVKIVGPDKEYMLNAVAKHFDTTEGDTIDKETIFNAISTQVEIELGDKKILLCGDCSYSAIEDKIGNYDVIQLPHHGKAEQAEKIFEARKYHNEVLYIISDNTGNTNGGSDKLDTKGHRIKTTKQEDILVNYGVLCAGVVGTYGGSSL